MTELPTIYKTQNYGMFKFVNGNRMRSRKQVENIKKSIQKNNLLMYQPILVDEDYQIYDGQHRLDAAEDLDIPIYYIIGSGLVNSDVHLLNTYNRNWTSLDYLESYIKMGMKDYIFCKEFMEEYNLTVSMAVELLTGNYGDYMIDFREGGLQIRQFDEAVLLAEHITEIRGLHKRATSAPFIRAIRAMYRTRRYDTKRMLDRLSKRQAELFDCSTRDQYIQLLEKIYNYNIRKQDRIPFKYLIDTKVTHEEDTL